MPRMTDTQQRELDELVDLQAEIDAHEEALRPLRVDRAKKLRRLIDAGAPKTKIAAAMGLHRSRIYTLLD